MARMIMLPNPPEARIGQGPRKLLAPEAGFYASGLRVSAHLYDKEQFLAGALFEAATVSTALRKMREEHQLDPDELTRAALDLIHACQGVLREMMQLEAEATHSQATRLVELVQDHGTELFHTPDKEPYATVTVGQHAETWQVRSRSFRLWAAHLYYTKEGTSPSAETLQSALTTLGGACLFEGPELPVYTRLAEHEGNIYLDLGAETWKAVRITRGSWEVVDQVPVKFRRMPGMLPLPMPEQGGTLEALRPLINVGSDSDWQLIVHWLLAALRPSGPYPILVVYGGHGSAKTSLVRILRGCVDPHTVALRRPPRDERDIAIGATNSWVFALDNLSHLPDWLSDALCCVSTGTGFATRALRTDSDEALFAVSRPVVVNGIEEIATRDDFLDRAIIVHLPPLTGKVETERKLRARVEAARPKILGACLTIVAKALEAMQTLTITDAPRMADFAEWSSACAAACGWRAEDILTAYKEVRQTSHRLTLEASLIWLPLQALMAGQKDNTWEGSATNLLAALSTCVDEMVQKSKEWPKKPHILSNVLRRLQPTLKEVHVTVVFDRDKTENRNRIIKITTT